MYIFLAALLCAAVLLLLAYGFHKQGPFTGTVQDEETAAPIPNVSVTDGRNVVQTDKDGKFRLKGFRRSHFITLTVPSGYVTEAFYQPVEKSVKSYDFSLKKSKLTQSENHCFVQISDTEIGADGTGAWLDAVKDIVKAVHPAFLIHTGDICYADGLRRHIKDMNTETMGCTVRYCIGNHDYVEGKFGEALYESIYGPTWYSFNVGKVHYVVTPIYTEISYSSCYAKSDWKKWLERDLAQLDSTMQVILFHHTKCLQDGYVYRLGTGKLDLKKHNLIAWIFGHYHANAVFKKDGVLNISAPRPDCGGIDSSAAGTRVISVHETGRISTKMQYYDSNRFAEPKGTLWQAKLNGNALYTDTLLEDGCIYTATADDDYPNRAGVYCLHSSDGSIKWFYKTKNSIKNNLALAQDRLVAMDAEGRVYCLRKKDGTLLWEKQVEFYWYSLNTSSGICIDKDAVVAGNAAYVTALRLADGTVKWKRERKKGEGSPASFTVAEHKLLVNSHWDALAALDILTGKPLWECTDEALRFRTSTPVRIDSRTVLTTGRNAVLLVDIQQGKIVGKTVLEDCAFYASAQPAYRNGIAYLPTSNRGIIAFSVKDKRILWNFKTEESILFTAPYAGKGSEIVESSPVLYGESLLFGANDGCIYEVNAQTGTLLRRYPAGSPVLGRLALQDNKLYAAAFSGYAVCYER